MSEMTRERLTKLEEVISRMRPVDEDSPAAWPSGEIPVFLHTYENFRDLVAEVRWSRRRAESVEAVVARIIGAMDLAKFTGATAVMVVMWAHDLEAALAALP